MSAEKKGGKATEGVRKMRMSNAVGRGASADRRREEAPASANTEATQGAESAVSDPAREKRVRITVDASKEQHRRLKVFAMDAETDGMSVMRALLEELDADPELASRIRDRLAEGER